MRKSEAQGIKEKRNKANKIVFHETQQTVADGCTLALSVLEGNTRRRFQLCNSDYKADLNHSSF